MLNAKHPQGTKVGLTQFGMQGDGIAETGGHEAHRLDGVGRDVELRGMLRGNQIPNSDRSVRQ